MQYVPLTLTKTPKKEPHSNKKSEMFYQIVRLTKENQTLQTKVDCLYNELHSVTALKQKYKKKYRELKQQQMPRYKSNEKIEYVSTEKNCARRKTSRNLIEIQQSKTLQEIEDPYTLSKNFQQNDMAKIMVSLSKIDLAISGLNEKIGIINQVVQPYKHQEIWSKIAQLSQNLNLLASKFQSRERSVSIQPKNNQDYGLNEFRMNIPMKQSRQVEFPPAPKLDRFRFIQSKSEKSFENELLRNGRIKRQRIVSENSGKKDEEWQVLKEIGRELQNWKFSISGIGRSQAGHHITE